MIFSFFGVVDFINNTQLPTQIREVDAPGLFTNPYFLIPFIVFLGYLLFKQAFNGLMLTGIGVGIWFVSGTEYMHTLIVDGELQVGKILPVMLGGVVVLGVVVFLLSRKD